MDRARTQPPRASFFAGALPPLHLRADVVKFSKVFDPYPIRKEPNCMPLRNVAEYLERSAARVPDKTAFSDAAGAVSYRQMLHDAQALGTVLAGLPGCRNAPVAVMIGRTAASVTAMQGVLQSGCYYVPIDEQMPEARMRSILGQVTRARSSIRRQTSRRPAHWRTARRSSRLKRLPSTRRTRRCCGPGAKKFWTSTPSTCSSPPARPARRRASSSHTARSWTSRPG